jgi:hypothetical protein
VYWQVSQWDSERGMSVPKKTCVGKLGDDGEAIYNKRFSCPGAMDDLDSGPEHAEAVLIGQSMLLDAACKRNGLT